MKKIQKIASTFMVTSLLFAGCSSAPKEFDVNTNEMITKVQEATNPIPMSEALDLTNPEQAELFGIDPTFVREGTAQISMANVKVAELTVVEAMPEKIEDVKKALEAHAQAKIQQFEQYLPDQYEIAKNYQLVQKENVFILAIGEDAETQAKKAEELIK